MSFKYIATILIESDEIKKKYSYLFVYLQF